MSPTRVLAGSPGLGCHGSWLPQPAAPEAGRENPMLAPRRAVWAVLEPRRGAWLPHRADLVRPDGQDDPYLVAASVPRVRSAKVAPSKGLDVLRAALGGDVDDPAADRVIARRPGHVADIHCYPRVTLDVLDLLVALDRVDHDMLAVGVDPGLGQLG